jgi:hypothetical protein
MSDVFVLDMASQNTEQSQVFVRRDSLAILDNQNQNYNSNQSIIDTSQLANSNKYMNYREAYLTIPMLLTMTGAGSDAGDLYAPANGGNSADWAVGLKNWYGSIIHSFTLDYNGTTICQQVPFSGLWNTFRLMTTFSLDDVRTQGSFIGFYPDTAVTVGFSPVASIYGVGTINNQIQTTVDPGYVSGRSGWRVMSDPEGGPANAGVNMGLYNRIQAWNFDPVGGTSGNATLSTYSDNFITATSLQTLWQSYISNKSDQTDVANNGIWQASILGIVYLKHLHKFFECVPLLRSAFLKLTLNLNITSVSFTTAADGVFPVVTSVQSPLGGVSPIMFTTTRTTLDSTVTIAAEGEVVDVDTAVVVDPLDAFPVGSYICSLSVGPECQNQTQRTLTYAGSLGKNLVGGGSITLNVPAYTFNPVYEQAYLSIGIKKIIYSDIYQFQYVNSIGGAVQVGQQPVGNVFNFIVSNGIANIKSVLVLPFFSKGTNDGDDGDVTVGSDGNMGILPFQSPFDPAGGGPTSPYIQLTQFNIQISGQNMIYNTERYSYEHFANQFKGVNAVDGGMADGTNSGLVGWKDWISSYNYYYVNCARCLPLEANVPKSINILGTSLSQKPIDLYVFTEYGTEISVDLTTGARV